MITKDSLITILFLFAGSNVFLPKYFGSTKANRYNNILVGMCKGLVEASDSTGIYSKKILVKPTIPFFASGLLTSKCLAK